VNFVEITQYMPVSKARGGSPPKKRNPEVFVASSVKGLEAAYALQVLLEKADLDVTVWAQGAFGSGGFALANLSELAARTDFAVFIFTVDDAVALRTRGGESVRQNLVLELGIFMGLLGASRTFMIIPNADALHLPTDLSGTAYLTFDPDLRPLQAALAVPVHHIVEAIRILGPRPKMKSAEPVSIHNEQPLVKRPATLTPRKRTVCKNSHLFISYSHMDRIWLARLQTMLKPLVRTGDIVLWDDTMIDAGREWRREIRAAISSAKVVLLLVSPDFLASEFIANNELPRILTLASKGRLVVLWAALSKSFWERTEIEKYQAAHDVSKPLDSYRTPAKRNEVLYEICVKITKALGG
jgi:predicted nucleotide-binding protein